MKTLSIVQILFLAVTFWALPVFAQNLQEGLAGYWKFDENANDSSGNGNDGTIEGDPEWVDGKINGALEFDGDDYVNCGNGDSLQIQDQITIAFWFQVEAFQNTWEGFLAKGDDSYRASRGGGNGNATHMGISGTTAGGGNGYFNGTVTVTDGQWHHYTGWFDGENARIYIDGELDTEVDATGQINISSFELYIGENSQQQGRFFHGLLDDVQIYNRALTEEEIAQVMEGGEGAAVELSGKLATKWGVLKTQ